MSHVAEVAVTITDLDALEEACAQLGLELIRGQTTFEWYGKFMNDYNDPQRAAAVRGYDPAKFGQCEHAIRRKGCAPGDYEIGLVRRNDGKPGYAVLFDSYGTGRLLERAAGADLTGLRDHYTAAVSRRLLARKGYRTHLQRTPQGELQVVATRG